MKASILIRAYNSEDTIERSVNSALGQVFPIEDFEIVIVNDGSTDRTREILSAFANDKRVVIIDQGNCGGVAAINVGLGKSMGEYITILDGDDEFESTFLKELSPVLDQDSQIDFVYPDYYEEWEGKKKIISPQNIFQNVMIGVLFRKKKLEEEGFYRENIFFAEYDLLLRTLDRWVSYHYTKPLFIYHRRLASITGDKNRVAEGIQQLKELHPDKVQHIKKIRQYSLYE